MRSGLSGRWMALPLAGILLGIACGRTPRVSYKELADSDPQVRADAAMRLGQARAVEGVDSLIAILGDPDEMVRVYAVQSLGQIGDKRAVPALLPLASDPLVSVRLAACKSLGSLGDPQAVPVLGQLLYDGDDTVRIAAARALGEVPGPESLDVLLKIALQDESETIRQHVVKVVGERRVRDAIPRLESSLGAESEGVRANAALVLGELADRSSVPALVRALDDPYYKVRSLSAHALARVAGDDPEVREALRRRFQVEDHGMVSVDLGWAMAKLADRSGVDRIRELLFKGDPEDVRAEAAMALGEIGEPSDLERLRKATYDKKGLVGRAAARAIKSLNQSPAKAGNSAN